MNRHWSCVNPGHISSGSVFKMTLLRRQRYIVGAASKRKGRRREEDRKKLGLRGHMGAGPRQRLQARSWELKGGGGDRAGQGMVGRFSCTGLNKSGEGMTGCRSWLLVANKIEDDTGVTHHSREEAACWVEQSRHLVGEKVIVIAAPEGSPFDSPEESFWVERSRKQTYYHTSHEAKGGEKETRASEPYDRAGCRKV